MAKKNNYYVVLKGHQTGIFLSWNACQKAVHGATGARYMGFETEQEAKKAWVSQSFPQKKPLAEPAREPSKRVKSTHIITPSLAVDAACSGVPGVMEYQGVLLPGKKPLFHQGPFPLGTNNIGEFLAIVHALAMLKQKGSDLPVYSDSKTAMSWVAKKKTKSTLIRNKKTEELWQMMERAEKWLQSNSYPNKVIKWETEIWGENPADFGRK